jgi:hypothetical protein
MVCVWMFCITFWLCLPAVWILSYIFTMAKDVEIYCIVKLLNFDK